MLISGGAKVEYAYAPPFRPLSYPLLRLRRLAVPSPLPTLPSAPFLSVLPVNDVGASHRCAVLFSDRRVWNNVLTAHPIKQSYHHTNQ